MTEMTSKSPFTLALGRLSHSHTVTSSKQRVQVLAMLDVCFTVNQNPLHYSLGWANQRLPFNGNDSSNTLVSIDLESGLYARKNRKRVRFATQDNGCVVTHVKTFARHASQRDRDVHWSKQEKSKFVNQAQLQAHKARLMDPARIVGLETAFRNGDTAAVSKEQYLADMQTLSTWAKSDDRGLEHCTLRALRTEQRQVVKDTVAYYKNLTVVGKKTEDDIATAVQGFSAERSTRAREFAVRMAVADVLALAA